MHNKSQRQLMNSNQSRISSRRPSLDSMHILLNSKHPTQNSILMTQTTIKLGLLNSRHSNMNLTRRQKGNDLHLSSVAILILLHFLRIYNNHSIDQIAASLGIHSTLDNQNDAVNQLLWALLIVEYHSIIFHLAKPSALLD